MKEKKNDEKDAKKAFNLVVFLLGMMGFFVMGDNYAASPIIVDIARDFAVPIGMAAMTVSAYMLPFGLFTVLFGPLADRYGKVRVITLAALGTALFSSLAALAFNIQSLALLRAVNGAFAAAILPVTISLMGDIFDDPKSMMNGIGTIMGMFYLGAAAATAIGGGLSYIGSWRLVYLAYGISEFIVLTFIYKYLKFEGGVVEKLSFKNSYSKALSDHKLLKIVFLLFLLGFGVFGSFTYLGDYFVRQTSYSILTVGLILTMFGLAAFSGGRKAGTVKGRVGTKLLLISAFIGLLSLLVIAWWIDIIFVIPALIGFGLAFVFLYVPIIFTAQQRLPKQRGTVMSLAAFNMFIGGALGVFVNGQIEEMFGYHYLFLLASVIILLTGLLGYLLIGPFGEEECSARDCAIRFYEWVKR